MVYKKDTSLGACDNFDAQIQVLDIPGEIKVGANFRSGQREPAETNFPRTKRTLTCQLSDRCTFALWLLNCFTHEITASLSQQFCFCLFLERVALVTRLQLTREQTYVFFEEHACHLIASFNNGLNDLSQKIYQSALECKTIE